MAALLGLAAWWSLAGLGRPRAALAIGLGIWFGFAPLHDRLIATPDVLRVALVGLLAAALFYGAWAQLCWALQVGARRPQLLIGMFVGLLATRGAVDFAFDHPAAGSGVGVLVLGVLLGPWLMGAPARPGWWRDALRWPDRFFDRGLNAVDAGTVGRLAGYGCALSVLALILDRSAVAAVLGIGHGPLATVLLATLLAVLMIRTAALPTQRASRERMDMLAAQLRRDLQLRLGAAPARTVRQRYAWYNEEV